MMELVGKASCDCDELTQIWFVSTCYWINSLVATKKRSLTPLHGLPSHQSCLLPTRIDDREWGGLICSNTSLGKRTGSALFWTVYLSMDLLNRRYYQRNIDRGYLLDQHSTNITDSVQRVTAHGVFAAPLSSKCHACIFRWKTRSASDGHFANTVVHFDFQ